MKITNSRLCALLLALGAFTAVSAQITAEEKPDIIYSNTTSKYVLAGLTVDEVMGFDHDLLVSMAGLTVGKTYEVPGADITEAVRRYWAQKLFSDVSIEADSIRGDKIYLHVHLKAQPRIASISWGNLKKSERDELQKRVGLQAGSQITQDGINRASYIIKQYYDDKGYKDAEVNIRQREDITGDNRVLVDIDINKKKKIKVHKIYISGVDAKEARKLKRAMKKTHEKSLINLFRSKKFIPEKYVEDKGFVIDKMNSWGYRDALLLSDSIVQIDESHVDVYLNLYKGQRYYVRNISWTGNTV